MNRNMKFFNIKTHSNEENKGDHMYELPTVTVSEAMMLGFIRCNTNVLHHDIAKWYDEDIQITTTLKGTKSTPCKYLDSLVAKGLIFKTEHAYIYLDRPYIAPESEHYATMFKGVETDINNVCWDLVRPTRPYDFKDPKFTYIATHVYIVLDYLNKHDSSLWAKYKNMTERVGCIINMLSSVGYYQTYLDALAYSDAIHHITATYGKDLQWDIPDAWCFNSSTYLIARLFKNNTIAERSIAECVDMFNIPSVGLASSTCPRVAPGIKDEAIFKYQLINAYQNYFDRVGEVVTDEQLQTAAKNNPIVYHPTMSVNLGQDEVSDVCTIFDNDPKTLWTGLVKKVDNQQ